MRSFSCNLLALFAGTVAVAIIAIFAIMIDFGNYCFSANFALGVASVVVRMIFGRSHVRAAAVFTFCSAGVIYCMLRSSYVLAVGAVGFTVISEGVSLNSNSCSAAKVTLGITVA